MAQQIINVGSSPNDGAGDPIRTAFIKTNTNFTQLFALPNPTPPTTLVGKAGDVPGMYAYDSNYFYYCFGTYNGSTVIWADIAQTGSISVANIVNGTSNVIIASANANVTISVNSVSNVAVFSTSGVAFSGNANALNIYANGNIVANSNITGANIRTVGVVSATGNVYGNYISGTYLAGDGSNLSNVAASGSNTQVQFNNNGRLGAVASFTYNYATSLLSLTGNIRTVGTISTTGNVTANYIIGNGSQLTGLPIVYGNANVSNFLPIFTGNISSNNADVTNNLTVGNTISATGNITTDGYFVGTFVGNVSGNLVVPGSNTQILFNNSGNAGAVASLTYNYDTSLLSLTGNIRTVGTISTTGNVTANYIIGNGSQLIGLPLTYGNANVSNFLPVFSGNITANNTSATGNVNGNILIGNYLYGDGSNLSNVAGSNYSNANVANYLPIFSGNLAANNISANIISSTGNITTAGYFVGNFVGNISGNLIVPGSNTQVLYNDNGNAGASAALTFNSSSNILSASGNIYSGNLSASGTTVSAGNIIAGASTDRIQLAPKYSGTNSAVYMGSLTSGGRFGINYDRGSSITSFIGGSVATPLTLGEIYTTTGAWSLAGNITSNYFLGNGSQLTGITSVNASANTLTGSTLSSNVTTSTLTSVGTLGNLSVTGNVVAAGVVTSTGTFRLPSFTTAARNALSAVAGDMIYNSDLQLIQAYQLNPATSAMGWVSWTVAVYQ